MNLETEWEASGFMEEDSRTSLTCLPFHRWKVRYCLLSKDRTFYICKENSDPRTYHISQSTSIHVTASPEKTNQVSAGIFSIRDKTQNMKMLLRVIGDEEIAYWTYHLCNRRVKKYQFFGGRTSPAMSWMPDYKTNKLGESESSKSEDFERKSMLLSHRHNDMTAHLLISNFNSESDYSKVSCKANVLPNPAMATDKLSECSGKIGEEQNLIRSSTSAIFQAEKFNRCFENAELSTKNGSDSCDEKDSSAELSTNELISTTMIHEVETDGNSYFSFPYGISSNASVTCYAAINKVKRFNGSTFPDINVRPKQNLKGMDFLPSDNLSSSVESTKEREQKNITPRIAELPSKKQSDIERQKPSGTENIMTWKMQDTATELPKFLSFCGKRPESEDVTSEEAKSERAAEHKGEEGKSSKCQQDFVSHSSTSSTTIKPTDETILKNSILSSTETTLQLAKCRKNDHGIDQDSKNVGRHIEEPSESHKNFQLSVSELAERFARFSAPLPFYGSKDNESSAQVKAEENHSNSVISCVLCRKTSQKNANDSKPLWNSGSHGAV